MPDIPSDARAKGGRDRPQNKDQGEPGQAEQCQSEAPRARAVGTEARYVITLGEAEQGPQATWRHDDTWAAMHQFARLVASETAAQFETSARVSLSDPTGTRIAEALVSGEERTLRFTDPATQDLYRHANRERQLALNEVYLENRITALQPGEKAVRQRGADNEGPLARHRRPDQAERSEAPVDPRQRVEAFLQERDPPTTLKATEQRRLDQEVLDRATPEAVKALADQAAAGDLPGVKRSVDAIRRQVESRVDAPAGTPTRQPNAPLEDRFTRDDGFNRTNWWFRETPDRLAFQERWVSLRTATNSLAAVEAMLDRAEQRGWARLYVEGSAEFKREVWIRATARGIAVVGYTATRGDREAVRREKQRADPMTTAPSREPARRQARTTSSRSEGNDGPIDRMTEAMLSKALMESQVPEKLHATVRESVTAELVRRAERGAAPLQPARIYDARAQRARTVTTATRPTDRTSPDRSR